MNLPVTLAPNIVSLVAAGLVFIIVFAVFALIARGAAGGPDVTSRLTQYAGRQQIRNEQARSRAFDRLNTAFSKGKRGSQIARNLARADLKLTVAEYIGIKILSAIAGALIGAFIGRASFGLR
jgi:tight adherence protein B